ncbi:MAG: TRAP transporter small permease subunit [Pseudomonadota bacterium]
MKQFAIHVAKLLRSASALVNQACWWVGGLCFVAMLLSVGLQVIGRYLVFAAPPWTEELARYCMVWGGLLGATVAFYREEDPVLVTRPELSSKTLSALLSLVRDAAVILFLLPVLVFSPTILAHHMMRLTESLGITSGYVFAIVPIFSAVILFHLLARISARALDGVGMRRKATVEGGSSGSNP